jgi:acyl-CoA synthetase (NDP forming)
MSPDACTLRTGSTLAPFFDVKSIAVIGASADPSKVGGSVLANLRAAGFAADSCR